MGAGGEVRLLTATSADTTILLCDRIGSTIRVNYLVVLSLVQML